MIRNVVLGRLHAGIDVVLLEEALAGIRALTPRGLVNCHVGVDRRLRERSWDFAITSDFVDPEAYREYDAETEHNRVRRELFDPICAEIARVQFEIEAPTGRPSLLGPT